MLGSQIPNWAVRQKFPCSVVFIVFKILSVYILSLSTNLPSPVFYSLTYFNILCVCILRWSACLIFLLFCCFIYIFYYTISTYSELVYLLPISLVPCILVHALYLFRGSLCTYRVGQPVVSLVLLTQHARPLGHICCPPIRPVHCPRSRS